MSGKIETKKLLLKHYLSNEHNIIANPQFTFSAYDNTLQNNLRIILHKYPNLDRKKVKDLLEELSNNLELAIKILQEEEQRCNQILQEKRVQSKMPLNLSQDQQNRILKKSFLNLYQKLTALTKQNEQLKSKNDSLKTENRTLRQINTALMERQDCQILMDQTPHVF